MSANSGTPFGGTIDKTVAGSKPWWPATPKPPQGAPNILVVLFDDVGFSDFGCYGSTIKTPTIDKLAAEGIRFNNYNVEAQCTPSRSAIHTGRMPVRSGTYKVPFPGQGKAGMARTRVSRNAAPNTDANRVKRPSSRHAPTANRP